MKKHSSALPKYKNKSSSYSLRLALESRLVFDGAMIATAVEVQQETAVDSPVTVNTSEAAPPPSEPNVDFVPEATPDAVAYQPNAVEESHQPAFAIDPALPESSNLPNLNAGLSDLNPSTPSIVEPRSAAGLSLLSDSPANTAIATLNPTPENFQQRSEPLHEQHDLVDTTANGILLEAPAAETPHELVFVDARVKDLQSFLSERASEIILLDPDRDGVEQIAAALAGRTGVDVIHILSHGDAGQLYLGNSTLDVHSISGKHTDELANIKAALSNNADILVYGCDVAAGAQGQAFVTALAAATGAGAVAGFFAACALTAATISR